MSAAVPATATAAARAASPWVHVAQAAAALAAGMGVGRFVYTPILPLMHTQAGLSAGRGRAAGHRQLRRLPRRRPRRHPGARPGALPGHSCAARLVVLVGTLAAMPAHPQRRRVDRAAAAGRGRQRAGLRHRGQLAPQPPARASRPPVRLGVRRCRRRHRPVRPAGPRRCGPWPTGGPPGGPRPYWPPSSPRAAWNAAPRTRTRASPRRPSHAAGARTEGPPAAGSPPCSPRYTLEGVGYIVAGTFLVAAIEQSSPGWIGSGAWVLVGLAAVPSSALWAWLGRRWSRPGPAAGRAGHPGGRASPCPPWSAAWRPP